MIYNMVTTTDNPVLYNWNLLKEMFSHTKKENMWSDESIN